MGPGVGAKKITECFTRMLSLFDPDEAFRAKECAEKCAPPEYEAFKHTSPWASKWNLDDLNQTVECMFPSYLGEYPPGASPQLKFGTGPIGVVLTAIAASGAKSHPCGDYYISTAGDAWHPVMTFLTCVESIEDVELKKVKCTAWKAKEKYYDSLTWMETNAAKAYHKDVTSWRRRLLFSDVPQAPGVDCPYS